MANCILFIFEGERTEEQIGKSFSKFFFNDSTIITCAYCNNIYKLYKEIKEDSDLDLFILLKDRIENLNVLKNFNRNDFAEIYLFFDYDGHDTLAEDVKIQYLLDFFCEETDMGKLYISYPMVESLKHFVNHDTFKDLTVKCKENINYKNIVSLNCSLELIQFNKYTFEIWIMLINAHLKKVNYIVLDDYVFPQKLHLQIEIFSKQVEKFINKTGSVSVISAFPVFIFDYFGIEKTTKLFCES